MRSSNSDPLQFCSLHCPAKNSLIPVYSGETRGTSVCQPNIAQLIPFAEFSEGFCLSQQLLEDERQGEGGRRGIARCPVQEQGQDGG